MDNKKVRLEVLDNECRNRVVEISLSTGEGETPDSFKETLNIRYDKDNLLCVLFIEDFPDLGLDDRDELLYSSFR